MGSNTKKVKVSPRERRKYRIRKTISGTDACPRLSVFKSAKYMYAQVISDITGQTLIGLSTKDKELSTAIAKVNAEGVHSETKSSKGVLASKALGAMVAEKCKEKGIETVKFDRNGFLYHGRVKAVADGAREGGLKI